MKMQSLLLGAAVFVGAVAYAENLEIGATNETGEFRPDGTTLCAKGSVTVPAGTKWVAYEEDMAAITQYTKPRVRLFTATKVLLPSTPIEITGVPDDWRAKLDGSGLRLAPRSGVFLLVR